ncbi:B-cell receptor CD22 [Enoplosus armatus]|uniref:B-cell receptor CD22 n=1 Tax=Enoplosus armatus TaxID=215367 RepID=UPI003991C9C9
MNVLGFAVSRHDDYNYCFYWDFSCQSSVAFQLVDTHLTAKEGSCIEIRCTVIRNVAVDGAYWFWMKNASWLESEKDFDSTVIYRTHTSAPSVSPDFAHRVTYTGSLSWTDYFSSSAKPECGILICDLKKTDSGNYSVRYVRQSDKWKTPDVNLTVTGQSLTHLNNKKSTSVTFTVNWHDDGKEFSCQTKDNIDTYLIKNISVIVEYAPKEISAKRSPENVVKGQSVTLTCSAKGRPVPTFTWFKNEQRQVGMEGAEWTFKSIDVSQRGNYYCSAHNEHGTIKSIPVIIDITYVPEVQLMSSVGQVVTQGDEVTLTCKVHRSNPQPHDFLWLKDGKAIGWRQTYVVKMIKPEDRGSYIYSPRKTSIVIRDKNVKVGYSLTLSCETDANPLPHRYSWYRHKENKQIDSSQLTFTTTMEKSLNLQSIQRTDEACYICNAANYISTGNNSEPACIQVLYPPTKPMLTMDAEVREGQLITISCTVESSPLSHLTVTRTFTSNPEFPEPVFTAPDGHNNTLHHKFKVTSTHAGFYTCDATNSEGSAQSRQMKLVVKYRPKDVTVQAMPGLVVNENMSLTLQCIAQSHPPVTSVTWMKMTDGKSEIIEKTETVTVGSVSPSDSGLYSCEASNEIGTGKSQQAEVKVKYSPKHTKISRAAELQHSDGKGFVTLSCSSRSYPPDIQYSWHKKMKVEEKDVLVKVADGQNYTVYSDQPGEYYCIAKNEISQGLSDPVQLFVDRGLMKALKFLFLSLIILLIIFIIFFVYRHKRNKSIQQGTTNTLPCFGFVGWWNGARRRNLTNEPVMAEPFRSRDDLLPDQPCRPNGQRRQPRPDSTPVSNINSVYCTVNLPAGQQGPSAQKPVRQQGGHTEANSLNYASLHFGNKQKIKQTKAEEDVVYAMVSKPAKKDEQERLEDYENITAAHAAKPPNPLNYDTDTSEEDEIDLNYSQVNFKAKPGHQRRCSDSSTSDDEDTQYSHVKI